MTRTHGYRTPARVIHWLMAVLILAMIPVGFLMVMDGWSRPVQNTLFIFHKNVGVLVLGLAVLRLCYRLSRPAPPVPGHLSKWQARAAEASHTALYVLIFAMPIAGYVRVRAGGFPIEALDAMGIPALVPKSEALAEAAKAAHFYGSYVIAGIIAVHILAALHHGVIKRDGVFSRIWPLRAPGGG
jgi:cytochrome b561